jgi:hypothetical protein
MMGEKSDADKAQKEAIGYMKKAQVVLEKAQPGMGPAIAILIKARRDIEKMKLGL